MTHGGLVNGSFLVLLRGYGADYGDQIHPAPLAQW